MTWDLLQHWDQVITLAINNFHFIYGNDLMLLLSKKEVWFPMYAIITYFTFRRLGIKNGFIVSLSIIITIIACDQTSNLVKDYIGRLRPCYSAEMLNNGLHILVRRSNHFGFFSAHAANSFGLAISSIIGYRNDKTHRYRVYTYGIILWAILVSLSRIFVGMHYFGDIFVGMIVGTTYGAIFGYTAKWIIKHTNKI